MKKEFKIPAILMVLVVSMSMILSGCGEKAIPADQTAKALYSLYVNQDGTGAKEIGLTDAEEKTTLDAQKKSSMQATKMNFLRSGLSISDKKLEELYAAQVEALKKLTPTIELVSEDKEVAKVKVSTSYVDLVSADKKAAEEVSTEITKTKASKGQAVEIYANKIIEKMKEVEPSKDKKEDTFEFKLEKMDVQGKSKEVWVPKDMQKFATSLGKMISGQ